MERELRIGQHLVFIDADRQERDALLICIHGDPQGRLVIPRRKPMTAEDEGKPGVYSDANGLYAYEHDEKGLLVNDYEEPGQHWPCINIVVVDKNPGAEDQYGRQTSKEHTSIVHWTSSSAIGYCWRFADEEVDWKRMQPSIK